MPNPDGKARRRGCRTEVITIKAELTAEEWNKKYFPPEEPYVDTTQRTEAQKLEGGYVEICMNTITMKEAFFRVVHAEGLGTQPKPEYTKVMPEDKVKEFKKKSETLVKKLQTIKAAVHTNNRLTDILRIREDLTMLKDKQNLETAFRGLGEITKHNSVLEALSAKCSRERKKLTVELYPHLIPEAQSAKEKEIFDRIQNLIEEIDNNKDIQNLHFVKEGLTVSETLEYIRNVIGKYQNHKEYKEMITKTELNLKSISEVKYLNSEEKQSEEEKANCKKIAEAWKDAQMLLLNQHHIENGKIFYSSLQAMNQNLKTFDEDAAKVEERNKELSKEAKVVEEKLVDSKAKINLQFIEGIQKDLNEIESKLLGSKPKN